MTRTPLVRNHTCWAINSFWSARGLNYSLNFCRFVRTVCSKVEFMENSTKTMPWVATHPWPVQNRAKMHWIVSINSLHNWMKLLEVVKKCSPWCIYSRANQCNDLRTLLDYLLSRRSVLGAYWNVPARQCTVMFFVALREHSFGLFLTP